MARPPKDDGEARDKLMQVRVQPREYESYKNAADAAGLDLSGWVRAKLREAAIRDRKKYRSLADENQ